jgi:predicted membrane channel-forming protein YqfA (hemolysin III family)
MTVTGLALAGANEQIGFKIIKLAQENHDWLQLTKSITFGISSLNLAFAILRMEKYTFGFPFTTSVMLYIVLYQ